MHKVIMLNRVSQGHLQARELRLPQESPAQPSLPLQAWQFSAGARGRGFPQPAALQLERGQPSGEHQRVPAGKSQLLGGSLEISMEAER